MRKQSRYQNKRRVVWMTTYTLMDEIKASNKQPMPEAFINHQVGKMRSALDNIRTGAETDKEDWRFLTEAINLMETLATVGDWTDCEGDAVEVKDEWGAIQDSVREMVAADDRRLDGKPMRLSGAGIAVIEGMIDDYEAIARALSARSLIRAHRITEKRIQDVLRGRMRKGDKLVRV